MPIKDLGLADIIQRRLVDGVRHISSPKLRDVFDTKTETLKRIKGIGPCYERIIYGNMIIKGFVFAVPRVHDVRRKLGDVMRTDCLLATIDSGTDNIPSNLQKMISVWCNLTIENTLKVVYGDTARCYDESNILTESEFSFLLYAHYMGVYKKALVIDPSSTDIVNKVMDILIRQLKATYKMLQ